MARSDFQSNLDMRRCTLFCMDRGRAIGLACGPTRGSQRLYFIKIRGKDLSYEEIRKEKMTWGGGGKPITI